MDKIEHVFPEGHNLIKTVYDPTEKTLDAWFQNGGIYRCFDFPKERFDALAASLSPGSFWHREVRPNHNAQNRKIVKLQCAACGHGVDPNDAIIETKMPENLMTVHDLTCYKRIHGTA